MTLTEYVLVMCEKFKLDSFKIVDIDRNDILWTSINDNYGISWDIKTHNIRIYYEGHQECFLSKYNIYKEFVEIDKGCYEDLINEMINSIVEEEEIIIELNKRLAKCVLFENYEEASEIRNFLKLFE